MSYKADDTIEKLVQTVCYTDTVLVCLVGLTVLSAQCCILSVMQYNSDNFCKTLNGSNQTESVAQGEERFQHTQTSEK